MISPLPLDVLFSDILSRLPAKSLYRFLCVCKQWQSFLTTPMFAKMHHHHHHKPLLIVLSTTTPGKFHTIDCETPEDGVSTVGRPLPFGHENMSIIASVRGLVCVRVINKCNDREYYDLILWNPLTNEYKTLPRPNNEKCDVTNAIVFGLYYSCNDYKLLLVTYNHDVYIYSLKSDSWRKVETKQEDFKYRFCLYWLADCWKQPCVLLNEKLYFIVNHYKRKLRTFSNLVIMFDLKTEKLRKIATPSFGMNPDLKKLCLSLTVVRGCIHLCMSYWIFDRNVKCTGSYEIVLWRMDGDGDGDWTKMVTYNNPPPFPSLFLDGALHLMKNGNWIMYSRFAICKVDLENHTIALLFSYPSNSLIINPGGKYMETMGINLFN